MSQLSSTDCVETLSVLIFLVGTAPSTGGLLNPVNVLSPVSAQSAAPAAARPQPNYNVSLIILKLLLV